MDHCMVQGGFLALAENSVNRKQLAFKTTIGLARGHRLCPVESGTKTSPINSMQFWDHFWKESQKETRRRKIF